MSSPIDRNRAETRWLVALKRHAGRGYVLSLAAPIIVGALLVAQAWVLADVLHRAIVGGDGATTLLPGIGMIALLIVVRTLVGMAGERAGIAAAERIKLNLRNTLFARILTSPASWTDGRSSGGLSSVIVEQVEAVDGFFSRFCPAMVQASVLPIAFAAIMLPLDWLAALLFLITAPLIPLFMALAGWGAEAATKRQASALSRLSGRFADRLRGITTLKLFGRADAETAAIHEASEELRVRTLKVLRIAFLSSAVLEFFAALGVAGVALYVGLSFLGLINVRGTPLPYEIGLFVLLMAPEVYQPLRTLAAHYHDRAAAKAAVGEIGRQFGELPNANVAAPALVAPAIVEHLEAPASIELDGLVIRTPGTGRTVIDGIDLQVAGGHRLAIVGTSGVGKSTLLEALARLRSFEGEVRLNGLPYSTIEERAFRQAIAFLPQRPRLFHGTIADNIRLGRHDASADAVARAADLACVSAFAGRLPLGLDTPLGDGGLGLSGGEIQRVALARIFLREPRLILLDEPTAHLDAVTERQVLDNLMRFAVGRTLIIATHSEAAATRADAIMRLIGGKLVPRSLDRSTAQALRGAA